MRKNQVNKIVILKGGKYLSRTFLLSDQERPQIEKDILERWIKWVEGEGIESRNLFEVEELIDQLLDHEFIRFEHLKGVWDGSGVDEWNEWENDAWDFHLQNFQIEINEHKNEIFTKEQIKYIEEEKIDVFADMRYIWERLCYQNLLN